MKPFFQFFSRGGTIQHGFSISIFPITIIHQELIPHAGLGRGNRATAGFHLTQWMGFSPVSRWILALFVITGVTAVQLALTLLAKSC